MVVSRTVTISSIRYHAENLFIREHFGLLKIGR